MDRETRLIRLINSYAHQTTEKDISEHENEPLTDVLFDSTIEGFAMYFDSIPEEEMQDFFNIRFGYYSNETIYRTPEGYYLVTIL